MSRVGAMTMIDQIRRLGGAERLALGTAVALDRDRFDRWLCVTRWEEGIEQDPEVGPLLGELEGAGVRILGLPRRGKLSLTPWSALVRTLRRERIGVLHAHMFGSNVWASLLGPSAGVPAVLAHEHNWSFEGGTARRQLDRRLIARRASAFITVSQSARRRMIELEGIDPAKLVLIRNGLPPREPGRPGRIRAELDIAPGAPVIGSVGMLRPEKAFDLLLRATSELADRFEELTVLIAGDGPERARLGRLSDELGLGGRVRFLGFRADIGDLLCDLDLAVCCSDFEGGPLSVMEYMAAGLPVVATDTGGLPELVQDGVEGRLVAARDPAALAAAIGDLLADKGERERLGAAASKKAEAFSFDAYIERIEALYASLLEPIASR